jgi:hypothetical protein
LDTPTAIDFLVAIAEDREWPDVRRNQVALGLPMLDRDEQRNGGDEDRRHRDDHVEVLPPVLARHRLDLVNSRFDRRFANRPSRPFGSGDAYINIRRCQLLAFGLGRTTFSSRVTAVRRDRALLFESRAAARTMRRRRATH